tara:strand:+ start:1021 stop:1602 length:582 start_codon:yes stop_codon:yes gene_type:complete
MSKNSRKNVVLIVVLSLLIVIKVLNDRSNQTPSELIFKGDIEDVHKILLYKGNESVELVKENDQWVIFGNDSLMVRENRIDDFFNKVLNTKKETLVLDNKERWHVLSVDDSLGTHLELYNNNDKKVGYYVFGRSSKDWKHNYVRIGNKSNVYLTDQNIVNNLNPRATFWGEKPKPIESDSLQILPENNIKENK